ncbi:unnamed protein product [Symbiodinium sp. CCMP2592]|nr:unnamed protein product [Symbiodinium sp. CCMP2592]
MLHRAMSARCHPAQETIPALMARSEGKSKFTCSWFLRPTHTDPAAASPVCPLRHRGLSGKAWPGSELLKSKRPQATAEVCSLVEASLYATVLQDAGLDTSIEEALPPRLDASLVFSAGIGRIHAPCCQICQLSLPSRKSYIPSKFCSKCTRHSLP